MSISPSPVELRARALTDLRMGLPVVIDLPQPLVVCAAETVTQDRLEALRALGEVQAVLSKWRARHFDKTACTSPKARSASSRSCVTVSAAQTTRGCGKSMTTGRPIRRSVKARARSSTGEGDILIESPIALFSGELKQFLHL